MIIRCDNCSVSLQLDESKVPGKTFTVRCPRCRNLVQATPAQKGKGSATVQQLETNAPAPAVKDGAQDFSEKESEFQINSALRSLLTALKDDSGVLDKGETQNTKPRRALLCLGEKRDEISKVLVKEGYKVYIAQTPAQANERLRDGKTELLIFSPDFAAEFGGAAILQQKINGMPAADRRRLFLVSVEDGGTTMNAHEAFLRNLNLIVAASDIDQIALILKRALNDFNDLYFNYNRAIGMEAI